MRKIGIFTALILGLLVVVYSCTKEINLITNIDYELETSYENNGFVKDSLSTTLTLLPESTNYPGYEYFLKYDIAQGEGYFVDENGIKIPAEEDYQLNLELDYTANWKYVGTAPGTHRITMYARDNFDRTKNEVLVYEIVPIEVLWTATATQEIAKVSDVIPITLNLENQSGIAIDFSQTVKLLEGFGKLLDAEKNAISFNQSTTIVEGETEFFFVPDVIGTTTLVFDLVFNDQKQETAVITIEVIDDASNIEPIAVAKIQEDGINKGEAPFTVTFDGAGSNDPDGELITYEWDFGDGSPKVNGAVVTHVFETIGQYIVNLTVTDDKATVNTNTDTNSLTIFVEEQINEDFIALDDTAIAEGVTSVVIGVLSNDQIAAGITAVLESATQPLNGATSITDGSVTYVANEGYKGKDKFVYTITDGSGNTSSAEVIVTVTITDAPPIAVDDVVNTMENTAIPIPVLDNDMDPEEKPITITTTTEPEQGEIVVNVNGTITYTPNEGYVGDDTFTYTITDGTDGNEATATVTINITDVNQPPVVTDSELTITDIETPTINLLDNIDDVEDTVTVVTVTALNGTVVDNGDGTILYTPIEGSSAVDLITFEVTDGVNTPVEGTIKVTITAVEMVIIPEGRFETYVINEDLDTRGLADGKMLKEDADNVAALILNQIVDITSLDFISVFPNLTSLTISSTITKDLNLSNLTKLEKLDLYRSTDDINLRLAPQLKEFLCEECRFTSIDMSQNTALEVFRFDRSTVANVGPLNLGNSTSLRDFYLRNSTSFDQVLLASPALTDATFSNCSGITSLDFSACTGLQTLLLEQGMGELTSININNGNNAVLTGFDGSGIANTNLLCVQVDDTATATLNTNWKIPGQGTVGINTKAYYSKDCSMPRETINIPDMNFEDLLIVDGYDDVMDGKVFKDVVQAIKKINLSLYGIQSVQGLEEFVSLENLQINSSDTGGVDVSKMKNLRVLDLKETDITSLNVSNNTLLEELYVDYLDIESIDFSNNVELRRFTANLSSLELLDLSNNPKVTDIDLTESNVTKVDLSNNSALVRFISRESILSSIKLPLSSSLEILNLQDSQITELSIKSQNFLNTLFVSGTNLNCIEVDNVADAITKFGVKPGITYELNCP